MNRLRIVMVALLFPLVANHGWAQVCGDGQVTAPEECDPGGICIGGSNAGSACTAQAQCQGDGVCEGGLKPGWACGNDADCALGRCVRCKTFARNGCAANCTLESEVSFPLVPGVSEGFGLRPGTSGFLNAAAFNIGLPISGSFTLRLGKRIGGALPVVISESTLPPVVLPTISCTCPRLVAARTCGGTVFERDGTTRSRDCTFDVAVCPNEKPCTFVHGAGNAASGTVSCTSLNGVDVLLDQPCPSYTGPEPFALSGRAGRGAGQILASLALANVPGSCAGPQFGPDGMLCTDDDPPAVRGLAETLALVTGTATGRLGAGAEQTVNFARGAPFLCPAQPEGQLAVSGTQLVAVSIGSPPFGGVVLSSFVAAPGPPNPAAPTPEGPTLTPVPPKPTCTPTPTFTRTSTRTATVPMSPSSTPSLTPTITSTQPPVATPTDTPLPPPTSTFAPTHTHTSTPAPSSSATHSPLPTTTTTSLPTYSPTPEATGTATRLPEPTATPTSPPFQTCPGDCNDDGEVTVDEIVTMVNIALENSPVSACPAGDQDRDGSIAINEIIVAVNGALNGCP